MKQTAVEWLIDKLDTNLDINHSWRSRQYIEQADKMFEEQIIQFATEYSNHILNHGLLTPTEFFKQNFKSK